MIERKYSLKDIDSMRVSIRTMLTIGNGSYKVDEKNAEIENRLRTYMMAGIEPADLRKAESDYLEEHFRRREEQQAFMAQYPHIFTPSGVEK
jgi:hypothetical protein